jgi:hypothetical protein
MEIIRTIEAGYDPERIGIMIMTRGRPELFKTAVASLAATAADPSRLCLWAYVDQDDPTARSLIDQCGREPRSLPVNWIVGPRTTSMGATFNQMCELTRETSGLFFGFSDDFHMETEHWDTLIRACYRDSADRLVLAYVRDNPDNDVAKIMVQSREWVDATGYFFPPYFPFWFGDLWIDQIARALGRKFELKIAVTESGGKGKTQRMWNLPFWIRFFNACAGQRFDELVRLVQAMPGTTPQDAAELESQRSALLGKFAVDFNNLAPLTPIGMVEVELMLTGETSAIPAVYLEAERAAVRHLQATGQGEARECPFSGAIPDGGVTSAFQAEVVRALLGGASFAEVSAHTPAQAARVLEWRNAYIATRKRGLT